MFRRLLRALVVLGACGLGAWTAPALAQAAPPVDPGPMPHPAEFFRKPADAGTTQPCKEGSALRRRPEDLTRTNTQAYHMANVLGRWGEINYAFQGGKPGCTDWDLVVSRWQAMVGLPVTGVFTQAESDSVMAERQRVDPEWKAAVEQWTAARVAVRAAGGVLDEEAARARRMAGTPAPAGVRPAPVGPPERQAFGLSLGAPIVPQLPACRPREGWFETGFQSTVTCLAPARRMGRSGANYEIELQAEKLYDPSSSDTLSADGFAVIQFSQADQPGFVGGSLKAWLVEGRLEGIGFPPRDKQAVLAAFESRYGKPEYEPVPMKNDQGGTWIGERYRFRANDVTATVNCVGFDTSWCSYAQILTERGLQGLRGERQREVQKGLGF